MIGTRVGRYRIDAEIGSGGMGVVYRATQVTLDRTVAVKMLFRHLASSGEHLARFRREAETLARLDHPGIVHIYDIEELDGDHFIIMEHVRGPSLTEVLARSGFIEPARARDIAMSLADALGAAHRQGIIHRDLKPDNILFGEASYPKLTDFGIAHMRDDQKFRTHTGVLLGTPYYLSPEQALGQPVTPSSDLYSLGVVLYEMLCGRVPFTGSDAISVALKHVRDLPEPLDIAPCQIPGPICRLVDRALEKRPEARFASAEEFEADLYALDLGVQPGSTLQSRPGEAIARPRIVTPPSVPESTAVSAASSSDRPAESLLAPLKAAPGSGVTAPSDRLDEPPSTTPGSPLKPLFRPLWIPARRVGASLRRGWSKSLELYIAAWAGIRSFSLPRPHSFTRTTWAGMGLIVAGLLSAAVLSSLDLRLADLVKPPAGEPDVVDDEEGDDVQSGTDDHGVADAGSEVVPTEVGRPSPGPFGTDSDEPLDPGANPPSQAPVDPEPPVDARPVLAVRPAALAFKAVLDGGDPPPQSLRILNSGGGTLAWRIQESVQWLSVSPASGTGPANVTLTVRSRGVPAGRHRASMSIVGAGESESVTLVFDLDPRPEVTNPLEPPKKDPEESLPFDPRVAELEIRSLLTSYERAVESGDFAVIRSLVSPSVAAQWEGKFEDRHEEARSMDVTIANVRVNVTGERAAIMSFHALGIGIVRDTGRKHEYFNSLVTWQLEKIEDRWKVTHTSS